MTIASAQHRSRPIRRPRARRAAAGVVAFGLLIAGCGGGDDNLKGDELSSELVRADLAPAMADCIAGELPDGLSRSAIEQRDEAEAAKFTEALTACAEQLGPTVSVPDSSIPDPSPSNTVPSTTTAD